MRTHWLLVLVPVAVVLLGAESKGPNPKFMELYYFPPHDGGIGTLLPRSVELLDSLHTLPRRVDLWQAGETFAGPRRAKSDGKRGWILVPVDGVASPLDRARALAAAGRLDKAAAAYAEAASVRDDGGHAAVMGATCELRHGDTESAVELMERADTTGKSTREWHEWTKEIHTLISHIEKGEMDQ